MGAAEKLLHTVQEYLTLEAQTDLKYEYYDGYIVDMAGGTILHAKIGTNLATTLSNALLGKECDAYSSDARVFIEESNSYLYPDVTVVCGPVEIAQGQSIANPKLLVEVMSESSERYDRGKKFRIYRSIPTLRQYVLVSQDAACIETYYRNDEGQWMFSDAVGLDKTLHLQALGIEIKLSDVYRRVEFEGKA
jgi:Uma2 family endonuclease